MDLENGLFDDWNQGTLFSDPVTGIELADAWFYNKGAGGSTTQFLRGPGSINTFEMRCTFTTSQLGSPNSTQFVYQDISNYVDYQGVTITVAGWFKWTTGGSTQIYMTADDGVNVHTSPLTSAPIDTYQQISFTFTVDPAATQLRITFRPTVYSSFQAGEVTLSVNLLQVLNDSLSLDDSLFKVLDGAIPIALSDSLVVADALVPPTGPVTTTQATGDELGLQDWLQIKVRSSNWGN